MKKFTLLILVMLLGVVGVKAQTLTNSWEKWGETCTVTDNKTISTTAQYAGAGCWWGTTDASSYDYIAVAVKAVTGTLKLYAQCGTSEPRTSTTNYEFNAAGTIYIDLNQESVRNKKAELVSLGIQQLNETGTAGCTVESITLITASDLPPRHEDLSLTTLDWSWNSNYNASTKTISFDANWGGNGWYLGNKNGNDYTRLIVEFGSPLVDAVNINVTYTSTDPSTSKDYTTNDEIAVGKTYHALTLNSSYKFGIKSIHFSNSTNEKATSCVLKRVYLCNAKYVALDDEITSTITAVDHADVELTRPFAAGYNSLCLPFATTTTALGATKAYEFTAYANGTITMTAVTDLAAGVPYIVSFAAAQSDPIIFTGVTVSATTPSTVTINGASFVGNFTAAKSANGLYGVNDSGDIQKGGASATINAYRAYFTDVAVATSRMSFVDFDGDVTSIEAINAKDLQTADRYYNLAGQRIAQPTKGIFIKNGKKYIVK